MQCIILLRNSSKSIIIVWKMFVIGQTICSFLVCKFWFWFWFGFGFVFGIGFGIGFELAKSIDSLLNFCCTCVCFVGPVIDVWYCNFDVSFICTAVSDVSGAVITGCVPPINGTATFAVMLVWDWIFRDFKSGGFLIDAENANPRRKIAL